MLLIKNHRKKSKRIARTKESQDECLAREKLEDFTVDACVHAREKSSEKTTLYETRLIGSKRSDKFNGGHAMH